MIHSPQMDCKVEYAFVDALPSPTVKEMARYDVVSNGGDTNGGDDGDGHEFAWLSRVPVRVRVSAQWLSPYLHIPLLDAECSHRCSRPIQVEVESFEGWVCVATEEWCFLISGDFFQLMGYYNLNRRLSTHLLRC